MLEIRAQWDDEARVWIATSEDVPGLCVQADTFEELVETAAALAPELLAANHIATTATIPLQITAQRTVLASAA
jgi:predicted RNase H-like HicB family nuclease